MVHSGEPSKMKLNALELNDERWITNLNIMSWTGIVLKNIYWRSCYSYILCSLIAGLQNAYDAWKRASDDPKINEVRTIQFVLTGTRGTGKSILGAFLGIVLPEFGWGVTYQYGRKSMSTVFGIVKSDKQVIIWDGSDGGEVPTPSGGMFLVLIMFKATKWHHIAQQNSWTSRGGNFIYIDPAPKEEVEAMAKQSAHAKEEWETSFEYTGGVPRLCLLNSDNAKEIIDSACNAYAKLEKLPSSAEALLAHDKKDAEKKIYPGLVAHFIPTMPFRADCHLAIASSYIEDKIRKEVESNEEAKTRQIMSQMLQMPKARSLAGWIWEPLFSKKARTKEKAAFVGCSLPATKDQRIETLLVLSSDYEFIEYDNLDDFQRQVKSLNGYQAVFDKAKKDNAATLDGVLLVSSPLRVIGIQLCVSQTYHPVKEDGIEELHQLFDSMKSKTQSETSASELWFVQPEECLETGFSFVSLQPLEFKSQRALPVSKESNKKRKRNKVSSSNKQALWSETAGKVSQYVVIPIFERNEEVPERTKASDAVKGKLSKAVAHHRAKEAADAADAADANETKSTVEPTLRSTKATIGIAKELQRQYPKLFNSLLNDMKMEGVPFETEDEEESNEITETNKAQSVTD